MLHSTTLPYTCEIKDQPERPTLSVRTHAAAQDLPQLFGQIYGALMQYMNEMGVYPAGEPFAAYYNMDMQNLDIEIGFPIAKPVPDRGEIRCGALPAGKFASTMHIGPYDSVGPAYEALAQFVKASGSEPTGVAYEFYFSGPETPPAEIRTQIVFPLKTN